MPLPLLEERELRRRDERVILAERDLNAVRFIDRGPAAGVALRVGRPVNIVEVVDRRPQVDAHGITHHGRLAVAR